MTEPLGGVERESGNTSPAATAALVSDRIARRGLRKVEGHAKRLVRLTVVYVGLDEIRPNTYNPNRQDDETLELLKRSILEDGFTQPVIVHESSKQIVDGEHRWRAARDLGMTQVPVVFVDMTDEQMRIATLRHNRARGSEDIELSVEVLRDLQELGAIEWAQESLMLSDSELNALFDDTPAPEALAAEEFAEAWAPERGQASDSDEDGGVKLVEREDGDHGVAASASTRAALMAAKDRAERIAGATSESDRNRITHELEIPYRIQFLFTGEEAGLVRGFLGEEPAERLLAVCQAEVEAEETEAAAVGQDGTAMGQDGTAGDG